VGRIGQRISTGSGCAGVPHEVFISYATHDKTTADAICATLEARKIRCWIAPRDILPGMNYAVALMNAITASRIMVLVFSSKADRSPHTLREVERAVNQCLTVIPFRIENIEPSPGMGYYIGSSHWLDAFPPPLEPHLARLADTVELFLSQKPATDAAEAGKASLPAVATTAPRIHYPEPPETVSPGPPPFASVYRRWAAYIIDLFIISFLWIVLLFGTVTAGIVLFGLQTWNEMTFWTPGVPNSLGNAIFFGSLVVSYVGYFVLMEMKWAFLPGASVGKYALGMRVVDSQYRRISLEKALIRGILKSTPLIIASVAIPFTEKHQALHDRISDTVVVKKPLLTGR